MQDNEIITPKRDWIVGSVLRDATNDCQDATFYLQPQLSLRHTCGSFLGYGSKFETNMQV